MLFDFFARVLKRRDATTKRPRAVATIDPANENIRANATSTRATSCAVTHGALTSAEIATIVDGIEYPADGVDRFRFAVGRRAANTVLHTPEI